MIRDWVGLHKLLLALASSFLILSPKGLKTMFNHLRALGWLVTASGPHYTALAMTTHKTRLPIVPLLFHTDTLLQKSLPCHCPAMATSSRSTISAFSYHVTVLYLCCSRNTFTLQLPTNEPLYSFQYSSFQSTCHNILDRTNYHTCVAQIKEIKKWKT